MILQLPNKMISYKHNKNLLNMKLNLKIPKLPNKMISYKHNLNLVNMNLKLMILSNIPHVSNKL